MTSEQSVEKEPEPPAFAIKNLRIGTPLTQAKDNGLIESCSPDGEGAVCEFADKRIGDVELPEGWSFVYFDSKGFDWFYTQLSRYEYDRVVENLLTAYGKPCRVNDVQLQNAFGAKFDSDEVSWCFSEGVLKAARRSEDNVNLMDLSFYRKRPVPPPKNYSPDSL